MSENLHEELQLIRVGNVTYLGIYDEKANRIHKARKYREDYASGKDMQKWFADENLGRLNTIRLVGGKGCAVASLTEDEREKLRYYAKLMEQARIMGAAWAENEVFLGLTRDES